MRHTTRSEDTETDRARGTRPRAAGFRTRRTGTSVSVLGIEGADGRAPEGERRPANLEDVFVLLTGEEID